MKIIQSHSGDYLKNGRRYRVVPTSVSETPASVRETMVAKGYVLSPLSILDLTKSRRLTEMALRRWQEENSGVTVNGVIFPTDERSRNVFAAFRAKAEEDPTFVVQNYKLPDGQFVELEASLIIAIDNAIHAHIQACFDKEETLTRGIIGCLTGEEVRSIKWNESDEAQVSAEDQARAASEQLEAARSQLEPETSSEPAQGV